MRSLSRKTPPKNGSKNNLINSDEKPRETSSSRVVFSARPEIAEGSISPRRTPARTWLRNKAIRKPSVTPTAPDNTERMAAKGRLQGSLTENKRPLRATSAPGSKAPNLSD